VLGLRLGARVEVEASPTGGLGVGRGRRRGAHGLFLLEYKYSVVGSMGIVNLFPPSLFQLSVYACGGYLIVNIT
jgi:hypothetical protein